MIFYRYKILCTLVIFQFSGEFPNHWKHRKAEAPIREMPVAKQPLGPWKGRLWASLIAGLHIAFVYIYIFVTYDIQYIWYIICVFYKYEIIYIWYILYMTHYIYTVLFIHIWYSIYIYDLLLYIYDIIYKYT